MQKLSFFPVAGFANCLTPLLLSVAYQTFHFQKKQMGFSSRLFIKGEAETGEIKVHNHAKNQLILTTFKK